MANLKVCYFEMEGGTEEMEGWLVGLTTDDETKDGVILTYVFDSETKALAVADKIGHDLELPVEKIDVLRSDVEVTRPWRLPGQTSH